MKAAVLIVWAAFKSKLSLNALQHIPLSVDFV